MLNSNEKSAYAKLQKQKQDAYRALFLKDGGELNEAARIVMADLRLYARITKSILNSDPLVMASNSGKQDFFNWIMSFLKVDYEEYFNLNEEYDYD